MITKPKTNNVRALFVILLLLISSLYTPGCSQTRKQLRPLSTTQINVPLVSVQGSGSDRLGKIELTNSAGYCEIDGVRVAAAAYMVQKWSEYDILVASIVAPTESNLNIMYLYSKRGNIRSVWHGDYDRPLTLEKASGNCLFSGEWGDIKPELSILYELPETGQLIRNIEITGDEIQYSNQSGYIRIDNSDHRFYPFDYVDCTDCVRGRFKGWHELHSIIESPDGTIGFGVLYLYVNKPKQISLNYRICLNPLKIESGLNFSGTWAVVRKPEKNAQ